MDYPFEQLGFSPFGAAEQFNDLSLHRSGTVAMISMLRLRQDKRAARQAGNNMDMRLIAELKSAVDLLERESWAKSILLASEHRLAFSIGVKIDMVLGSSFEQTLGFVQSAQELLLKLHGGSKPLIAALNGMTFGGGLELAMGCDYRIAGERDNVRLGLPETSLGVLPAMGGTQNLPRLIGAHKAREFILTAKADITPAQAKEDGLIDTVVPADALLQEALAFSKTGPAKKPSFDLSPVPTDRERIRKEIKEWLAAWTPARELQGRGAPLAQALAEFVLEKTAKTRFCESLVYEQEAFACLVGTSDSQEGIHAMLEGRPPVFQRK
ncbi:MAG: enoyl-CoA hydratase/isomerase family protein [Elusimicrobiota bacterium]|jgi:enoyl-CoA hydratase/carnithine racemase